MATETNNAEVVAEETAKKESTVFVTAGEAKNQKGEDLTIIGFGSLKPYEREDGKQMVPSATNAFAKIKQIDNFLKAVDADKIGLNIKGKDEQGKDIFMRADAFYHVGTTKSGPNAGKAYGFDKISITVQPQIVNEKTGEVTQEEQKLFATKKPKVGFQFDKNCDDAVIAKFNNAIKDGADFTLAATKNSTLEKYPSLMQVANQIKGGSANIELDFVKMQGAVIKSITPVTPDGKAKDGVNIGSDKIVNHATKKQKSKDIDR